MCDDFAIRDMVIIRLEAERSGVGEEGVIYGPFLEHPRLVVH